MEGTLKWYRRGLERLYKDLPEEKMLIIGGVVMLMLGLIGEYVGRIYICINKAPQYVVKEDTFTDREVLQ